MISPQRNLVGVFLPTAGTQQTARKGNSWTNQSEHLTKQDWTYSEFEKHSHDQPVVTQLN